MNKYFIPIVFFLTTIVSAQSPTLTKGGLAGNKTLVLTSKSLENASLQSILPQQLPYLHYTDTADKIQFAPQLPNNQNWVALFNVKAKKETANFFMYDGWMASTLRITTNHRLRRFETDITQKISSNAYHMAFQRKQVVENEVFMLVVSPIKQKVIIQLSKEEFGVERLLEYDMNAQEAKFVHVVMPPKEYTVITWQPEITDRKKIQLHQWQFAFDKNDVWQPSLTGNAPIKNFTNWQAVKVPHTWNTTDVFDSRNFKDSINIMEMFQRGIGWYTTNFFVAASAKTLQHHIHFLGVNQIAEVWVNKKYIGKHVGGYNGFSFNISNHIDYGKNNTILVKVDNQFNIDIPPHTADYNFLGGMYREVFIETTNASHIQQTKISTPKVSYKNAHLQISASLSNGSVNATKAIINLVNPYNEIMASWIQPIGKNTTSIFINDTIKNPILWSTENPTLYKVYTTLYNASNKAIDQTVEQIGFRFFKATADNGFFLNGEKLKLKGVNVHQDFLNKGWAVDSTQKLQDYLWMKKMGVNYVRMSHYPKHPYELHLCDSLGFVVWEEIPVVNTVGGTAFIAYAKQMMQETIERDYNHPSIIFWGVGNEYYRNFFTKEVAANAIECTKQVAAVCKQLDPHRYTIQAHNDLVDYSILNLTDIQGRNRYFGWYEKTYNDFEHEMEVEHKQNPNWKLLISEYGAEGKYGYHVPNPTLFDHSETYQVAFHKAYWQAIDKHNFILGGTIWNMFDFGSFAKIGNSAHFNKKGILSFDRKPKDVFYYYQSMWTEVPMIRIAGHTYTHRTATINGQLPIEVFSNATEVELFVNNISLGKKTTNGKEWIWNFTQAKEGVYKVRAIGYKDGITVTDATSFFVRVGNANNASSITELDGDGF